MYTCMIVCVYMFVCVCVLDEGPENVCYDT